MRENKIKSEQRVSWEKQTFVEREKRKREEGEMRVGGWRTEGTHSLTGWCSPGRCLIRTETPGSRRLGALALAAPPPAHAHPRSTPGTRTLSHTRHSTFPARARSPPLPVAAVVLRFWIRRIPPPALMAAKPKLWVCVCGENFSFRWWNAAEVPAPTLSPWYWSHSLLCLVKFHLALYVCLYLHSERAN